MIQIALFAGLADVHYLYRKNRKQYGYPRIPDISRFGVGMKLQSKYFSCLLCVFLIVACARPTIAFCEEFFIVSDGDTILVGADIESYSCTTHLLALTCDGFVKWTSYENQPPPKGKTLVERTLLTDKKFSVLYAGELVAEGYICSGTESSLQTGLNLWDSLTGQRGSRLSLQYCRFEPDMRPDPLESDAFLEYFRKNGKLVGEE